MAQIDLFSGHARVPERAREQGRHTPRSTGRAANVCKRLDIPMEEAEPFLNRRRRRVSSVTTLSRSGKVILISHHIRLFRAKTLFLEEIEPVSRHDRFRRVSGPSLYIFIGMQTAAARDVDLERHEIS